MADAERLHEFLAEKNVEAARRAVAVIDAAVRSLAQLPLRGRPAGIAGIRELIVPFGRSGYVVRYAYLERRNEIVILRLWHSREEPI